MSARHVLSMVLCTLAAVVPAFAQLPADVGSAIHPDADPIAFFASLAQLPTEQQDAFLAMVGQAIEDQQPDVDCNVFGGKDSCKTIPDDSKFAASCKKYRQDLNVDCAYYSASEDQLEVHPGDALQHYLQEAYKDVSQHCPECMESLQALWCVQALPECGSFQTHVHKAIFPAILAAKKAEDQGQPQSIALAESVPGIVDAMTKTMACKEMCQAAVATCACGKEANSGMSFGQAITDAEKKDSGFAALGLQTLGDDFRDTLFRDIWNKPICDIFASKDDPEFAGICDLDVIGDNAKCSSSAFCDGLSDDQVTGTEAIIAAQLARSVFGFVEGPAGVIAQRESATETVKVNWEIPKKPGTGIATPTAKPTSTPTATPTTPTSGDNAVQITDEDDSGFVTDVEVSVPSSESKGSGVGTAFGVILALIVVAGVGAFGWKKYQEYKINRYGDYGPMDPYGDDGIPLQ